VLWQRLLVACVLAGVLLGVLSADYFILHDSLVLHVFMILITFVCAREFWPLCRAAGHQTFSRWGTISACFLVAAHYWHMHLQDPHEARLVLDGALVVAVLTAFLLAALRRQLPASLGGLGVTCLGLLYLWFLPSFLLKVRHLGANGLPNGDDWNRFGTKMLLATVVLAKGCDFFAYVVGRWAGRRKAFPNLSPGKTIEGVSAGLGGSVLLALLLHWDAVAVLPAPCFDIPRSLVLGLALGFAGIMGDLSESLLKRSAGVKDAGRMVPGYGGLLDIMDSLVVAGPVAYFLIPVMLI
jgi:phosphatidate cytidylyltransferase